MPVIFKYGNLKFFFYSNEGNPREPMHVHVRGPDGEAKIWIKPAIGIAESKGFNSRELNAILRQIIQNHARIAKAWYEHFGN
jgi:hypothetical protein